LTNLD